MVEMMRDQRGYFEDPQRLPIRPTDIEVLGVSSWFQTHLDRLAAKAGDSGIRLVIYMTPEPRPANPIETRPLIEWLKGFEARHSHAIVGRPEVSFYDCSQFATRWHLNRQGAELFTEVVLETLERRCGLKELASVSDPSDKIAVQDR
jgi:hypothetical protein